MKSYCIYLASRYSRKHQMKKHAEALRAAGFKVTSSWLEEDHAPTVTMDEVDPALMTVYAMQDLHDVDCADTMVFFAEYDATPRGGRHVEFGYALAKNKRIIVVGPKENIFHLLPGIEHVDSFNVALANLKQEVSAFSHHTRT